MKLSEGRLQQLMAYADGELSGTDRIEVEALLSESHDAREFLAQLGHLGGLVRDGWQERPEVKKVASFDIADDIMKAVAAEAPKPKGVTSLEEARAKKKKSSPVVTGGIVVAFLAAAAAVALVARSPSELPVAKAPVQATAPAAPAGPGVEVEAVGAPGSSVSVYQLPGASELSTSVVVWVEEQGEKP